MVKNIIILFVSNSFVEVMKTTSLNNNVTLSLPCNQC